MTADAVRVEEYDSQPDDDVHVVKLYRIMVRDHVYFFDCADRKVTEQHACNLRVAISVAISLPLPDLMSDEEVASARRKVESIRKFKARQVIADVGDLVTIADLLEAYDRTRTTLLRLLGDVQQDHPDMLNVRQQGYDAGRKAGIEDMRRLAVEELRQCCQDCRNVGQDIQADAWQDAASVVSALEVPEAASEEK